MGLYESCDSEQSIRVESDVILNWHPLSQAKH
jgi:hypothetical protein